MGTVDARPDLVERGARAASLERRLEQLPDNHPASPRYARDNRGGAADGVRPLTDAEHAEHVADVRTRLDEARKAGLSTDVQHTTDDWNEVWSDEREAIHSAIIEEFYERHESVPCEGKAILAGGLPGSGKTTVLREHAGIDLSHYMMVNPDDIKIELGRRGLVPMVEGLSPMEASDLVHEECSHIAKRLANRAEAERKNVIWDITMSRTESAMNRVDSMRAAGYFQVDAVFIDIPTEVSARRADNRYREDHELYRSGYGFGGRLIPGESIAGFADPDWGSQNRRNFEELKSRFDTWRRFDNSVDGRAPILMEEAHEH